jgi:hypothetical protein
MVVDKFIKHLLREYLYMIEWCAGKKYGKKVKKLNIKKVKNMLDIKIEIVVNNLRNTVQ